MGEATMPSEKSIRREIEDHLIRTEKLLADAYALFALASALGEEPPAETVLVIARVRRDGDELREILNRLDSEE
jgi:hypothetical protein